MIDHYLKVVVRRNFSCGSSTFKEIDDIKKAIYPAIFSRDGDYIFGRLPNLPDGFTQGNDALDTVTMTEDLIGNLLED